MSATNSRPNMASVYHCKNPFSMFVYLPNIYSEQRGSDSGRHPTVLHHSKKVEDHVTRCVICMGIMNWDGTCPYYTKYDI